MNVLKDTIQFQYSPEKLQWWNEKWIKFYMMDLGGNNQIYCSDL